MAQAAWSDKTNTWSADTYLWANTTYDDTLIFAATNNLTNNSTALYPSGIILSNNQDITGSGGFSLVGYADFDMSAGSTASANTIYINAITFANDTDFTSVGNMPITGSIVIGSSLDIPQPGTIRWEQETGTWADHTGSWGYVPSIAVPVDANLTQINLSQLHEEDAEKLASAVYALSSGVVASGSISVPVSATLANEQDVKFNINFEESITISGVSNMSSVNSFLWNDIPEDTATTWTKVADPDE